MDVSAVSIHFASNTTALGLLGIAVSTFLVNLSPFEYATLRLLRPVARASRSTKTRLIDNRLVSVSVTSSVHILRLDSPVARGTCSLGDVHGVETAAILSLVGLAACTCLGRLHEIAGQRVWGIAKRCSS